MADNQDKQKNVSKSKAYPIYGSLDQRFTFVMTRPMRLALEEVSAKWQMSVSNVIRQVILNYANNVVPGFTEAYLRYLHGASVDDEKAHK